MSVTNQQNLPNSTAILVLGIISIVGCVTWGVIGLVCGIVALALYKKDKERYIETPDAYTESSFNNINTGRICAIIGVSLSSAMFLFLIAYMGFWLTMVMSIFGGAIAH